MFSVCAIWRGVKFIWFFNLRSSSHLPVKFMHTWFFRHTSSCAISFHSTLHVSRYLNLSVHGILAMYVVISDRFSDFVMKNVSFVLELCLPKMVFLGAIVSAGQTPRSIPNKSLLYLFISYMLLFWDMCQFRRSPVVKRARPCSGNRVKCPACLCDSNLSVRKILHHM